MAWAVTDYTAHSPQDGLLFSEIMNALQERWNAYEVSLGQQGTAGFSTLGFSGPATCQSVAWWQMVQTVIANWGPSFLISHVGGVPRSPGCFNGDQLRRYKSLADLFSAAGLPYTNFRAYDANGVLSYRQAQHGDLLGPWLFEDIHALLNVLVWLPLYNQPAQANFHYGINVRQGFGRSRWSYPFMPVTGHGGVFYPPQPPNYVPPWGSFDLDDSTHASATSLAAGTAPCQWCSPTWESDNWNNWDTIMLMEADTGTAGWCYFVPLGDWNYARQWVANIRRRMFMLGCPVSSLNGAEVDFYSQAIAPVNTYGTTYASIMFDTYGDDITQTFELRDTQVAAAGAIPMYVVGTTGQRPVPTCDEPADPLPLPWGGFCIPPIPDAPQNDGASVRGYSIAPDPAGVEVGGFGGRLTAVIRYNVAGGFSQQ